MSLKKFIYKPEFDDLKGRIDRILKDIDDASFNIFNISTQNSQRENFHRDVIALLLKNDARHYASDLYLFLLVDLLNIHGANINKDNYQNVEIIIENPTMSLGLNGRIDTLIKDNKSKHCIIIENKMNHAGDTQDQLERYYTHITDEHYIVDSIVYIPLNDQKRAPNTYNSTINKLIINIPAYSNNAADLYHGWLLPCYNANVNQSANSFVYEYSKLIKHLSKMGLDKDLKNEFYDILSDKEGLDRVASIIQLNSSLEEHRANLFMDFLKGSYEPFKKIARYRPYYCLFFGCFDGKIEYKLDVQFLRDRVRVDLWNPGINSILEVADDVARQMFSDKMVAMNLKDSFNDPGYGNGMCKEFYVSDDLSIKEVDIQVRDFVQTIFKNIKLGLNFTDTQKSAIF